MHINNIYLHFNGEHVNAYYWIYISAYFCIYLHIWCIFFIAYFGICLHIFVWIFRHICAYFLHIFHCIFWHIWCIAYPCKWIHILQILDISHISHWWMFITPALRTTDSFKAFRPNPCQRWFPPVYCSSFSFLSLWFNWLSKVSSPAWFRVILSLPGGFRVQLAHCDSMPLCFSLLDGLYRARGGKSTV